MSANSIVINNACFSFIQNVCHLLCNFPPKWLASNTQEIWTISCEPCHIKTAWRFCFCLIKTWSWWTMKSVNIADYKKYTWCHAKGWIGRVQSANSSFGMTMTNLRNTFSMVQLYSNCMCKGQRGTSLLKSLTYVHKLNQLNCQRMCCSFDWII